MKAEQVSKTPSYRTEREFGLLVGGVFLAVGSWWLYRGRRQEIATGLAGLGTLLMLLGLVFPKSLVYPNKAWMGLAHLLSKVTTPIILGLVFFLVVLPTGFLMRLAGIDPLRRRAAPSQSYWTPYNDRQQDHTHFERMY